MKNNNIEERKVITHKKQIPFIRQCMEMLGYHITDIRKVDRNWIISMNRTKNETTKFKENYQKQTEEKLRLIEITSRKKCGFNALFLNFLIHIILFCIQGAILYRLNLETAHPKIMLETGVLLFMGFLCVGFAFKCIELFKWNRLISRLKAEIISGEHYEKTFVPEEKETRIISVLFTRSHGLVSNLIYWVSGRQYTHASIGLGEQTEEFFSFDYRGLRCEHPSHRKTFHTMRESLCYQFSVTPQEYATLENTIHDYLKNQSEFKYNLIGAIFSVFHIYMPLKSSKAYFCSEFVSSQLSQMNSFHLKKKANMYLPTNLSKALITQTNLCRVIVNEI